jgi:hypothetical protein
VEIPGWAALLPVALLLTGAEVVFTALDDFPLPFDSRYCFLLVSKSGSLRYSSKACVNPVGA